MCRRCLNKKLFGDPKSLVTLGEGLTVTKAVEKRLRKKVEAEVPRTRADSIGSTFQRFLFLVFGVSAFFIANRLSALFSELWWLFVLGWIFGGYFLTDFAIDKVLSKPRNERKQLIASRILELAEERKRGLEEQARFYSSPEWAVLRKQVIEEEGLACAICNKKITDEKDITVDHKLPRSKYPDLQFSRSNLQVLCRKCNASKGTKEWGED